MKRKIQFYLNRIKDFLMRNEVDTKKIGETLARLETKITHLGLYANIIDKYFDGFNITAQTRPFSLIMNEFVRHLMGQLAILLFDKSKKYNVISIAQLYKNIKLNREKSIIFQKINSSNFNQENGIAKEMVLSRMNEISSMFNGLDNNLKEINCRKKSFKKFRNKSYAHHELIHSEEELKNLGKERDELKISWAEFRELIDKSQEIIKIMTLYWEDSQSDFMHNQYDELSRKFWALIKV